MLEALFQVEFTGASGKVQFGEETSNQRNSKDIAIGLYNIVPATINPETKKRSYSAVLVSKFNATTGWHDEEGVEIFRRHSSGGGDIEFADQNYLTPAVRSVGLSLMAIAWLVSFAGFALVQTLRNEPAVQRAQPFFMQVLCLGAFVMSSSIFFLSWDEGAGWTENQLCTACILAPWCFFAGQIITLCALFTKLWRVDEVLQFRRRSVSVSNVMKPTLALLSVTTGVLISWTIADPWIWHRETITTVPPVSYGYCYSSKFWYFFGPLMAILLFAESLTLYFAWKTSDLPDDFRDSEAVFYATFAQLQAWSIGIPILIVLEMSNADATYFGRIFLIWIFAVSSVLIIVGPKVSKAISMRTNPRKDEKPRCRITGVVPQSSRRTPSDASSRCNSRHCREELQ